jgi:hypothetical protein
VVAGGWQAQRDVTWCGSAAGLLGVADEPREGADGSPQRLYVARVRVAGYRCVVGDVVYLAGDRAEDAGQCLRAAVPACCAAIAVNRERRQQERLGVLDLEQCMIDCSDIRPDPPVRVGLVAVVALAGTMQDPAPAVVGQVLYVAAERLVDPQPGVGEQRDAGACCRIDNICR